MSTSGLAVVGVTACNQQLDKHPFNIVGEKYLASIVDATQAWPLVIPSLGICPPAVILERLDGILFTGSPSNIEPHHYQGEPSDAGTHHDPNRDATTLPLLKTAVEMGIPVLAICRGFQEMNVVYGGSLHQKLHDVGRYIEHREDPTASLEVQYGLSHGLRIKADGLLHQIWEHATAEVNSLHTQGIDRLGNGLRVEACAPDGLVEAFSVIEAKGFALGVQFHPEWQVLKQPFYRAIFAAFNQACLQRATHRAR